MSYNKTRKQKTNSSSLTRKQKTITPPFFEKYNKSLYSDIFKFLPTESLTNFSNANKNTNTITKTILSTRKNKLINKYNKKFIKIIDLDSANFLTFETTHLSKEKNTELYNLIKKRRQHNRLENVIKANIFIILNLIIPYYNNLRFNKLRFNSKKTVYIFKFKYLNTTHILPFELNKNNSLKLIENKLIIDILKNKLKLN